jgi:chromosome segregation ATPase
MFQSSAFQSFAFQTVVGIVALTPNGGAPEPYQSSSHQIQQFNKESAKYAEKIQQVKTEARAVEYKLDDLEFRRLKDLADEAMQLELLLLLQEQQNLQLLLVDLQEKESMMRMLDDEFLILIMAQPFYA